jgi:hypothetical protein
MSTGTISPQHPAVPVRHRLNIDALTPAQLAAFRAAIAASMKITDERGYNYQAGIHGLPLPSSCDIAHGQPIFLPWHRAYLYFFELTLRPGGADVTLLWWDWTTDRKIPKAYAQARAQGKKNPLHSAKVDPTALAQGARSGDVKAPNTVRFPGQPGSPPLPSAHDIDQVLGLGATSPNRSTTPRPATTRSRAPISSSTASTTPGRASRRACSSTSPAPARPPTTTIPRLRGHLRCSGTRDVRATSGIARYRLARVTRLTAGPRTR